MKLIVCSAALTVLCLVAVRQGHEIKNAAYDSAQLLAEIDNYETLRLGLSASCCREGSPALLVERAERMKLALVHPFDVPKSLGQPRKNGPHRVVPKEPVAVASSRKKPGRGSRYLSLAKR